MKRSLGLASLVIAATLISTGLFAQKKLSLSVLSAEATCGSKPSLTVQIFGPVGATGTLTFSLQSSGPKQAIPYKLGSAGSTTVQITGATAYECSKPDFLVLELGNGISPRFLGLESVKFKEVTPP